MKTGVTISVAVTLGCVVALWLFGLAFNSSTQEFSQAAITPILVVLIACIALVAIHPIAVKWFTVGIVAPTLILNGLLFLAVVSEGRGAEWAYLTTTLEVIAAAVGGSMGGLLASRVIQRKSAR
jgi:hypothetical protein